MSRTGPARPVGGRDSRVPARSRPILSLLCLALVAAITPAVGQDVGFVRVLSPGRMVCPDSSLRLQGLVRNFSSDSARAVVCSCHVLDADSREQLHAAAALTGIGPGDSALVEFSPVWIPDSGNRFCMLDMQTRSARDSNPANDSIRHEFAVFEVAASLSAPLGRSGVVLDGVMTPEEWWDAARYDVSNVLGAGDSSGRTHRPGSVRLWLKHDAGFLYLACDAVGALAADSTSLRLFIDDNNNREWEPDSTEGAYSFLHRPGARPADTVLFLRLLPGRDSIRRRATGSRHRASFPSGRQQSEMRIPFGNRPCSLDVTPGDDTCGLWLVVNLPGGAVPGYWPTGMAPDSGLAPANFGRVVFTDSSRARPEVGVSWIAEPQGVCDTDDAVRPRAIVQNSGPVAAAFSTRFRILDAASEEVYADTVAIELAPGNSTDARFRSWPGPHPEGEYMLRCSTVCGGDSVPGNDLRTGSFRIAAGYGDTGWKALAQAPIGAGKRNVRAGACLAGTRADADRVSLLKGGGTCEFYEYDCALDLWSVREPVPLTGTGGRKKPVRKGACCAWVDGMLYAAKGNGSLEFWRYTPGSAAGWRQLADVPAGTKKIRYGAGMCAAATRETTFVFVLKGSGTQECYAYDVHADVWRTLSPAPPGPSGRMFKSGSGAVAGDSGKIYCLKGNWNEFYAYDPDADAWRTLVALPFAGRSGQRKRAKEGAGLAFVSAQAMVRSTSRDPGGRDAGGCVYALKGGNTLEFWTYYPGADAWVQGPDLPTGGGRRVKSGGSLTAVGDRLFALKGNNTREFYQYRVAQQQPATCGLQSATVTEPDPGLRITPNPFRDLARVSYSLPGSGDFRLYLYDVTGALVRTLATGRAAAGSHSIGLQGSGSLPKGAYFLRLVSEAMTRTEKLIVE